MYCFHCFLLKKFNCGLQPLFHRRLCRYCYWSSAALLFHLFYRGVQCLPAGQSTEIIHFLKKAFSLTQMPKICYYNSIYWYPDLNQLPRLIRFLYFFFSPIKITSFVDKSSALPYLYLNMSIEMNIFQSYLRVVFLKRHHFMC